MHLCKPLKSDRNTAKPSDPALGNSDLIPSADQIDYYRLFSLKAIVGKGACLSYTEIRSPIVFFENTQYSSCFRYSPYVGHGDWGCLSGVGGRPCTCSTPGSRGASRNRAGALYNSQARLGGAAGQGYMRNPRSRTKRPSRTGRVTKTGDSH